MVRLCFVCLGNICRSPTAEAVMRGLVEEAGLSHRVVVESAGTSSYHVGEPPDPRAAAAAQARGVTLDGRARRFDARDWDRYDYVLAMDSTNLHDLERLATRPEHRAKLHLLRSFDPESPRGAGVPDPYYGGEEGFEEVVALCEAACTRLLDRVRADHGL